MSTGHEEGEIRDSAEAWPVESSVQRYEGGIVGMRTDRVRMPGTDGTETVERDRLSHPGSVAVVALDEQDRVLLIRQYRHAAAHQLWEIPAGLRDVAGEAALHTAERELLEESGHRAKDWWTLVDFFPSPGFSDERIRVYLAQGLSEVPEADIDFERVHEEADMPIAWLPLDAAVAAILGGRLHNACALVGIMAAHAAAEDGFANLAPARAEDG